MATNEQLLEQFAKMDTDHNNELSTEEVTCFLSKNGFAAEYIKKFMETFDANKDGKISKSEFTKRICNQTPHERKIEMWEAVFKSFDTDCSGKLSAKELQAVLKGNNYDKETLEKFIKSHDKDGDGELNYKEFFEFLHKKN